MTALTASEFSQLMDAFAPFESPPTLLIATSGGPDSMALALLAHQWATDQGGKVIAITVDHQLRKESTAEAHQVRDWLKIRGIEHHILPWHRDENQIPQTAIQSAARAARYQLLGQWCTDHTIKHLLTAHHAQDQLETFMIRLAKGSGLKGLTGIQGAVPTPFGRILRPLLTVDAQDLKDTLHELKQPFINDPSNENQDFTRIRWRKLLPTLIPEGLTPQTLQETLERLNHAQRLIDQHISTLLNRSMTLSPYGYAILKKEVRNESPEAFEEILKRLFATIGTRDYPVRRQALHRAMDALLSGKSMTLGGCQILDKANDWWITREPAAIGAEVIVTQPGTYLWDDRFTVEIKENTPCRIAAMGESGIQQLGDEMKAYFKNIPHVVLQTLPTLWQGEDLVDPTPSYTFTSHF